ncbi:YgiQ family radical SAM protein [Clostridium sp. SYSU_GA19001]|uniref:YgiQ family radical SAM protein n=1 Tax=Clostridium caldaquaticum TaxID=2940653 RepID=UPI0020771D84|nr:YgiQ family radical SAM protein [Clostridium caldaquaticum]MCM8711107.1 YgiQ family radical SAM protein [Clostridium caldaquaticum]
MKKQSQNINNKFLPISKKDMEKRNIEQLDFVFISGDAYVDHPSFGTAVISRILEDEGFTVGIIAQPNWNNVEDFRRLGKPKLGFLINSGNIDSMVNHYTAAKKRRSDDLYSPGGKSGFRPDRAVIVYANRAREAYKDVPIILGGIEASLRRFAHYDYWDDKVRRSILIDSKADLIVYGMGEKTIIEIANLLKYGMPVSKMTNIRGTVYVSKNIDSLKSFINIPSFEEVSTDKKAYAESFKLESYEQDTIRGKTLVQKHGDRYIVQNPPALSLSQEEMDRIYNLPYARTYHPIYEADGGIPAINEVKFSITSHRGCFGSCAFCALTFHQGRTIQNRSQTSILQEAELLTKDKDFKGYIHDVGGPTANFRHKACKIQEKNGVCKTKQCLHPSPCKNLIVDHNEYLELLRKMRKLPGVKKVFIRSGIRYDYLIYDKNEEFFIELCKHHISGQLKVAPEHINKKVLFQMRKPTRDVYEKFVNKYNSINKKLNKKQYLVPYLMSSHPGSDLNAAIELALYIKEMGYTPEQVQDFYPTPGSLSTTIYYTGINPFTGENIYVPKTQKEKNMQRALLQFNLPENYNIVKEALIKANRKDLIGIDKKCLIPPTPPKKKVNKTFRK